MRARLFAVAGLAFAVGCVAYGVAEGLRAAMIMLSGGACVISLAVFFAAGVM